MLLLLTLLLLAAEPSCASNILVVLLDDVDDLPITRAKGFPNVTHFFSTNGVIYNNAFVTTPICCPSRASIFTGTYQHNHRTLDNTVLNGCDGSNWDFNVAPNSMGKRLQDIGYRTGMFGKYSNNYRGDKVPVGWDTWMGLLGNSVYYDYTINRDGKNEKHGKEYKKDYLPELIIRNGIDFMTKKNTTKPWFAFLSFPTAHEPFDAAPEYQGQYKGSKPPTVNYPSFNHTNDKGKHWYVRSRPPIDHHASKYNELGWRRRLQSLQTIDQGFLRILNAIDHKTTSIIFTSDNGFYFGEWGMILDKRQPYENTIRVPMFASGPLFNTHKGASIDTVVLNIDIAPTVLQIAQSTQKGSVNVSYSLPFDGVSMVNLLGAPTARNSFLVEYHGMGDAKDKDECSRAHMRCWYKDNKVWQTEPKFDIPDGEKFCFCVDSTNNTFWCERRITTGGNAVESGRQQNIGSKLNDNFLYCEFYETEFNEYYDLHTDPFQMKNAWPTLPIDAKLDLRKRLNLLRWCRGFHDCNSLQ